ncbi:hypothetical protein HY439_03700 [Candidatus Microgenomates bacterium]|nr:hypothetical protein [Candidatus Microgenomates bacterium]
MAKFVPDSKTHRWVIISPHRIKRPGADELGQKKEKGVCPFCMGNEKETPPEVFRIGEGEADNPGWQVRVVPNKYPITDIHEVIIHSPDHEKDISRLTPDQARQVLVAYRERYQAHQNDGKVLIFCNQGLQAGASLAHPHSQLVVLPDQINLDVVGLEPVCNIICKTNFFWVYCPDFSQWPYEVWLAPVESGNQGQKFGSITDLALNDLTQLLQEILQKLNQLFPNLYYNYYIYPGESWYLRIIPRLVDRAGFELGTGLSVNVKDPAEAAKELRE